MVWECTLEAEEGDIQVQVHSRLKSDMDDITKLVKKKRENCLSNEIRIRILQMKCFKFFISNNIEDQNILINTDRTIRSNRHTQLCIYSNTSVSITDRKSKQKVSENTEKLYDITNHADLIEICKTITLQYQIHIFHPHMYIVDMVCQLEKFRSLTKGSAGVQGPHFIDVLFNKKAWRL